MPNAWFPIAKRANATNKDEYVLLIEGGAEDARRILDALDSATDGRFRVEWVRRLSSGIERLRSGGVGAVLLDLTLPDSQGVETFDRLIQSAPRVPIVILSEADTEEMARQYSTEPKTIWSKIKAMATG
jgi:DNA-binding response OmpR family regulator